MINLFIVLVGTFAIAFLLIFFIAKHDKKIQKKEIQNEDDTDQWEFREFTKMCIDICEGLKLDVTDVNQIENEEIAIRAESKAAITKVQYLIVGFFINKSQFVDTGKIMEISDQIVSERLSKGIIMTSGQIDQSIRRTPELAPLELIDRNQLQQLAKEYKMSY